MLSQNCPVNPTEQRHRPVTGWQSALFWHLQRLLHDGPNVLSLHGSSHFEPCQPGRGVENKRKRKTKGCHLKKSDEDKVKVCFCRTLKVEALPNIRLAYKANMGQSQQLENMNSSEISSLL